MKKLLALTLSALIMFSTAPFTAFAEDDKTPPEIYKDSLAVDADDGVLEVNESALISLEVYDDSEISEVSIVFHNVEEDYDKTVTLSDVSGVYEGSFNVDSKTPSGTWKVYDIFAKDNCNNESHIYNQETGNTPGADFSAFDFQVTGTNPDVKKPVIDAGTIEITNSSGSFPATLDDVITLSVKITDNVGVAMALANFKSKVSDKTLDVNLTYDSESGKYKGSTSKISSNDPSGEWRLESVAAFDTTYNYTMLYNSQAASIPDGAQSADFSAFDFDINGTGADITPPVIEISSFKATLPEGQSSVITGEKIKYEISVTDDTAVSSVTVRVRKDGDSFSEKTVYLNKVENTDKYKGELTVTGGMGAGLWKVFEVCAKDTNSNFAFYCNSYYESSVPGRPLYDLSAFDFTVDESCKVSFNSKGGSAVSPIYVKKGQTIDAAPTIPTKDGFVFGGWYSNEACTVYYDFKSPVNSDIVIYANWLISLSISNWNKTDSKEIEGGHYTVNDFMEVRGCINMTVESATHYSFKAYPDTGFVFVGWYKGQYTGGSWGQSAEPLDMNDPANLLSAEEKYRASFERSAVIIAVFEECHDHVEGESKITVKPTCTGEGVETVYCAKCKKAYKTFSVPAEEHNAVVINAVPPTFTRTGKTAGMKCLTCGKILTAQKTVPKLASPSLAKVTKGRKAFVAKWNKFNVDGYEIRYSVKKNMKKSKTVKLAKSKTGVKVKKLKKKKTYYVQIRGYKKINSKKVYSGWSAKKKVKTK